VAALRANPIEVLRATRKQALTLRSDAGKKALLRALRTAQRDLERRLRTIEPGSFTATKMEITLRQIRLVTRDVAKAIQTSTLDAGNQAAEDAADQTIRYMTAAERRFKGINERLPIKEALMFDRATSGAKSSILHRLESDPKKGPGILERYGDAVVKKFEEHLQQRFLAGSSWEDTRNSLVADSPFLQGAPASWAERIVRTEVMGAHGRANFEASREVNRQLGDVTKILCATFDRRTGSDSFAVHGQIRRPDEAFAWWEGLYQHPPNRPNDREIVLSHRTSWPIPAELAWRSDSEVAARWALEGRKGAPPPRPKMTTVPLDRFG
jgi:hypothetical protein